MKVFHTQSVFLKIFLILVCPRIKHNYYVKFWLQCFAPTLTNNTRWSPGQDYPCYLLDYYWICFILYNWNGMDNWQYHFGYLVFDLKHQVVSSSQSSTPSAGLLKKFFFITCFHWMFCSTYRLVGHLQASIDTLVSVKTNRWCLDHQHRLQKMYINQFLVTQTTGKTHCFARYISWTNPNQMAHWLTGHKCTGFSKEMLVSLHYWITY